MVNNSVSVDFLEKSPEMTVFISEKDLSPTGWNAESRTNLNTRIECIREDRSFEVEELQEEHDSVSGHKRRLSQEMPWESQSNKENTNHSQNQISKEELMKRFNSMLEPNVNYSQLLLASNVKKAPEISSKEVQASTDEITDYIFSCIFNEIKQELHPQRVIVGYIRNKVESSSSVQEEISESEEIISDSTTESENELCIKTDSEATIKYAQDILDW